MRATCSARRHVVVVDEPGTGRNGDEVADPGGRSDRRDIEDHLAGLPGSTLGLVVEGSDG
jgi:hypothetical protein